MGKQLPARPVAGTWRRRPPPRSACSDRAGLQGATIPWHCWRDLPARPQQMWLPVPTPTAHSRRMRATPQLPHVAHLCRGPHRPAALQEGGQARSLRRRHWQAQPGPGNPPAGIGVRPTMIGCCAGTRQPAQQALNTGYAPRGLCGRVHWRALQVAPQCCASSNTVGSRLPCSR